MRSLLEGLMRLVCAAIGIVTAFAMGVQAQQSTQAQRKTEAQQSTQQFLQKQLEDAKFRLEYGDCPGISLSAKQHSVVTMWTVSREDTKDPAFAKKRGGSGIHVDLKSSLGALRTIELSVSYIAPGARVMAAEMSNKNDLRQKTFDLSVDGLTNVDRDLLVGSAFQITRVHLVSATFANGQVWRATSEDACSVEPDRLLMVADK